MREVLENEVEVVDLYPVFMKHKSEEKKLLFSKEHHVSALGAKIIGQSIAEYIKQTTISVSEEIELGHERYDLCCSDYYAQPDVFRESADVYFIQQDRTGMKQYFWNQNTGESKIAIFGDCNLQSYTSYGAGISANLSYFLKYPVYNAGRMLIFESKAWPITRKELDDLLLYDIVIYLNFASAPFVRSATMSLLRTLMHPSIGYNWCSLTL